MEKILWTTFLTTILLGTTFPFIPEQAILKIWQKLVFNQTKFLFSEKYTTDMEINYMGVVNNKDHYEYLYNYKV